MFQLPVFQLPAPLYLTALVPALSLLVYAYLQRSRLNRVLVGTSFLLEKIKREAKQKKRFKPPWLFFLELLFVLLLALLASGLHWGPEEQKLSFILDNSLSSSAVPAKGEKSLFERMKEEILFLAEDYPDHQFEVYVASPQFEKIHQGWLRQSALPGQLENLSWQYSRDNLSSVIQTALTQAPEQVVVITDKSFTSEKDQELPERLEQRKVSMPDELRQNLFVSDYSVRDKAELRELNVQLGLVGEAPSSLVAQLEKWQFLAGKLERVQVDSKEFNTFPKAIQFSALEANNFYALSLLPSTDYHDAIESDNFLYIQTNVKSEADTLVVSKRSPEELNIVRDISGHLLKHQYFKDFSGNPEKASSYIFHRVSPQKLPSGLSLLISIPQSAELALQAAVSKNIEPSAWSPVHPLTKYVNWDLLRFSSVLSYQKPFWAEELVSTVSGALVLAGENDGRKIAVTGFDLFPFQGKENLSLSIFTLNVLNWLEQDSEDAAFPKIKDGADLPTTVFQVSGERNWPASGIVPGLAKSSTKLQTFNFLDASESLLTAKENFSSRGSLLAGDKESSNNLLLTVVLSLLYIYLILLVIRQVISLRTAHAGGLK